MIPSGTRPGAITPLRSQLSQRESGGFVTRSRQCDVYTSVAMGPNWAAIRSQSEFGERHHCEQVKFHHVPILETRFFFSNFLISFNKEEREKKSSEPLLRLQPLILSNDSSPFFRIGQFIVPPTIYTNTHGFFSTTAIFSANGNCTHPSVYACSSCIRSKD